MMSRTQITLDSEMQRRARERAGELGVSLAEYVRLLVARDLGQAQGRPDRSIFDLGRSGDSDIARHKSVMIAEASAPKRRLRRTWPIPRIPAMLGPRPFCPQVSRSSPPITFWWRLGRCFVTAWGGRRPSASGKGCVEALPRSRQWARRTSKRNGKLALVSAIRTFQLSIEPASR